jgi:transmembrane sensor
MDEDKAWSDFSRKLQVSPVKEYNSGRRMIFGLRKLAVAASVLIILGISAMIGWNAYMSQSLTMLSTDETLSLHLNDGSNITLNRDSELSYPRRFSKDHRTVHLNGEAFFEVAHQSEKPFIVETAELTVTVLGTSFFVRDFPEQQPEVMVETGRVQCYHKPTGNTVILEAGQNAVFGPEKLQAKKSTYRDMNRFAWKTYNLRFENESLGEIVKLVNRAYGSQMEIDEKIMDCRLTVNFNSLNIDGVLNVLQSILDVKYLKTGDKIILKGEGC